MDSYATIASNSLHDHATYVNISNQQLLFLVLLLEGPLHFCAQSTPRIYCAFILEDSAVYNLCPMLALSAVALYRYFS